MQGPSKEIRQAFVAVLSEAIKDAYPEAKIEGNQLELSVSLPDPALGDLSSSISFKLAKEIHKNPSEIAQNISAKAKVNGYLSKVTEAKGYVNAFLNEKKYGALVIGKATDGKERYGSSELGNKERVIVEFPSINPNKPWLVSHLRNALLGDTICNIMDFCSYQTEREDYVDDLGLQMAESLWGWLHLNNKISGKADQWFGEQYVDVNRELDKGNVKGGVDVLLKKLEEINSEESKMSRKEIAEKAALAQHDTAFSYGVYHDVMIWESDIVRADLLDAALKFADKILEKPKDGKYAGATVVKLEEITKFAKELEGSREDAKVIIRSNGAATYIGKDFAFHSWKFGLIDADFKYKKFIEKQPNGKPVFTTSESGEKMEFGKVGRAINIIDTSQSYEQTILRVMFSLLGHEEISKNLIHLAYGKVRLEEGDLGTRKGGWMKEGRDYTADELLRETRERAREIALKSEKIVNKEDIDKIANAIALSAIRFEYLRIAPEREIIFSWKSALNFEANSGPYVMYTYARARKILKKANYDSQKITDGDSAQMTRGYDLELVKKIGMAQEVVEKACNEIRPNVLTDYLLELSSLFSKFYETMPVIRGGGAKNVRLAIVNSFAITVENMLGLLGIRTVEEM